MNESISKTDDGRQIEARSLHDPAIHNFLTLVRMGGLSWESAMEKLVLHFEKENTELKDKLLEYIKRHGE